VETEIRKVRMAEIEGRREEKRSWKEVGIKREKIEREKKTKRRKKNGSKKSSRGVEDLG